MDESEIRCHRRDIIKEFNDLTSTLILNDVSSNYNPQYRRLARLNNQRNPHQKQIIRARGYLDVIINLLPVIAPLKYSIICEFRRIIPQLEGISFPNPPIGSIIAGITFYSYKRYYFDYYPSFRTELANQICQAINISQVELGTAKVRLKAFFKDVQVKEMTLIYQGIVNALRNYFGSLPYLFLDISSRVFLLASPDCNVDHVKKMAILTQMTLMMVKADDEEIDEVLKSFCFERATITKKIDEIMNDNGIKKMTREKRLSRYFWKKIMINHAHLEKKD